MRISRPLQQACLLACFLCHQSIARAELPTGATVVGGAATINQSGANQVINQTTAKAIIDWQTFSIGAGNSVSINQPNSSSILLNRVIGGSRSDIYGSLSANGQVFIVNPFGVYFGAGSSVDVGGLLATTLNIRNEDFMTGNYTFKRESTAAARREVINEGVLKARAGGYIVLAGDYAANKGIIQARLGTVALAAGNQMTLDIQGDSLISFAVNEKTVADLSGVENSGQILADGGRAYMTAAVARDLSTAVVNNSGLIQAHSTVEREGAIYLSADGGNTLVSGTLDASGSSAGQKGGTIQVLGDKVALVDQAVLNASGDSGGGKINVGGNFQGTGPLLNARTAYVGKDVKIKADAIGNGNGGDVVIWSDEQTRYYGDISAQGGALGGNGGNVEVSGKERLDYRGSVNTLAAQGKAGTLLLDPTDIEIVTTVGATPDMTATSPFEDASNDGGTSQMSVGALEAALGTGNVTVRTTSSGTAPKSGTITIDDGGGGGVQWSAATTLKLQADNQIVIKSNVEGSNAGSSIWLDAVNGASQKAGTHIAANSLLLTGGGSWDLAGVESTGVVNSRNDFNTVAANITGGGLVRFSNNKNFTVGTVDGTSGFNHANGETRLYIDGSGTVNLAQNVTATTLLIRATGGVTQTGGSVQANTLALAGGAATLNQAGNNVNTLAANINGALSYTDTDRVTIGSASGINGITTSNHDVTLTTGDSAGYDRSKQPDASNLASLILNESINAGSGNVRLTTGSGGAFQRHDTDASGALLANGSITANALLLKGSSSTKVSPFVLTNAANRINTLAASANGSISFAGAGNSSTTVTVGSIDGINGINTTSNTVVSTTNNADGSVTSSTNENNVSISIGGNLNIDQNITASTASGTDTVSLGIGGDFTARTASGIKVTADTLGVFGDDNKGTFNIVSDVANLAAAGGKLMVIDNSQHVGDLTGIGIGAPAAAASATNGGNSVNVNSASRPVGDFYLTTSGGLNIIKLMSQGSNLMLRSSSLNILLDAVTADGARIMLQPYNLASKVGINNSSEAGFAPDINYDAATLLKFTNPTSTFFFGTPQNVILQDANVPAAAKNTLTGDVHIGYDGAFNLGYRSLSAQTSGNMIAYNVGPLYNLRLAAPNLTINSFSTFGPQMHFFSNNLSLPGSASAYVNPNKPEITLRSLNNHTMWIGNLGAGYENAISPQTIVKMPDGSTIIISGSTDYAFPEAGSTGGYDANGNKIYGDIHIPWNSGLVLLGNRKLILSTGKGLYTYNPTPIYTSKNDGGTSGGLWQGCLNLTDCMGTNPSPFPNPDPPGGGTGNDDSNPGTSSGGCQGCPPAPANTNPYPPETTPSDGNGNPGNDDNNDNNNNNDSNNDNTNTDNNGDGNNNDDTGNNDNTNNDDGGDNNTGVHDNSNTNSGGTSDGDNNNNNSNNDNTNTDNNGDGNNNDDTGNNDNTNNDDGGDNNTGGHDNSKTDSGGTSDGDNNDNGNEGDGDGTGDGDNGPRNGSGGNSTSDNGDGTSDNLNGGDSDGNGDGASDGNDGSKNDGGDGNGDRGAGTGSGGTGDGDGSNGASDSGDGSGDGSGGNGSGDSNDSSGDGGAGNGSGGTSDGSDNSGNGATGNGNGGDGDGNNGSRDGGDGSGDGSGGNGSGDSNDSSGDGGAGNGSGGTSDGSDNSGNGATGNGNGGAGDGKGGNGNGDSSGGKGAGDGNGESGDAGSDTDSGDTADGKSSAQSPAFDISCQDVSASRQEAATAGNQNAKRNLVEVKREGLKLRDPCQQQAPQNSKR